MNGLPGLSPCFGAGGRQNDKSGSDSYESSERVELMDVLRGVALFGVFLVNLTQFASVNVMSTETQLLSLPSAAIDLTLYDVLGWLFFDKANTIFAFLFGLGFYLQMQRLEARGADFDVVYFRRLCVLLAIGSSTWCSSGPGTSCTCTHCADLPCWRCETSAIATCSPTA